MATVNLPSKVRIFQSEDTREYSNRITPQGEIISFYQGYYKTSNAQIADWLVGESEITEITGKIKESEVPVAPSRRPVRGPQFVSPTLITPQEILQRAVASSANTPQAAESNSVAS